jgi:hypothetical protein
VGELGHLVRHPHALDLFRVLLNHRALEHVIGGDDRRVGKGGGQLVENVEVDGIDPDAATAEPERLRLGRELLGHHGLRDSVVAHRSAREDVLARHPVHRVETASPVAARHVQNGLALRGDERAVAIGEVDRPPEGAHVRRETNVLGPEADDPVEPLLTHLLLQATQPRFPYDVEVSSLRPVDYEIHFSPSKV